MFVVTWIMFTYYYFASSDTKKSADADVDSDAKKVHPVPEPAADSNVPPPLSFWALLYKLVSEDESRRALISVFCAGIGFCVIGNLLPFYLRSDLKASEQLLGLNTFTSILLEYPLFFFSKEVETFFGGLAGMLCVGQTALLVRFIGYSFLDQLGPSALIAIDAMSVSVRC